MSETFKVLQGYKSDHSYIKDGKTASQSYNCIKSVCQNDNVKKTHLHVTIATDQTVYLVLQLTGGFIEKMKLDLTVTIICRILQLRESIPPE